MQNSSQIPESSPDTRAAASGRPDAARGGADPAVRTDASTGPLLPQSPATPGDPNHHAARRVFGTSLGMFLPALILLVIGIAVIVWIAW
jgi:hypothetical protein